jgi:hypothetical protein
MIQDHMPVGHREQGYDQRNTSPATEEVRRPDVGGLLVDPHHQFWEFLGLRVEMGALQAVAHFR